MPLVSFFVGIASSLTSWLALEPAESKKLKEQLESAFHEAFTNNADAILPLTQNENFTNELFALAKGTVIDTSALIKNALDIPDISLTEQEITDGLYQFSMSLLNIIAKSNPALGNMPVCFDCFRYDLALKKGLAPQQAERVSAQPTGPNLIIPFRRNLHLCHHEKWIKEIRDILCADGQVTVGQSASVYGGGGLGKTAMAVEYAYRFLQDYPGGVYWFPMDQGFNQAVASFLELAQYKIPELKMPDPPDERLIIEQVLEFLNSKRDKLVILDNLVQDAVPEEFMNLDGHILVTTRRRDLFLPAVEMDLPEKDNALDILLAYAGKKHQNPNPENRSIAIDICERLGWLPLALEIVGRLRLKYNWPALSQKLEKTAVQEKGPAMARLGQISVLSALRLAEQEFQQPLAKDVLIAAGYLHPDDINPDIIGDIFQITPDEALEILVDLSNFSLMEPDADHSAYLVHRLTQEAARFEDDGEEIGEKVAVCLNEKVTSCQESGKYLKGYHLIPHLLFLSDLGRDREYGHFPTGMMVNEWAIYLWQCGGYSRAENIFKACLVRSEKAYGKENLNYAILLNNLANVLEPQGKYEEAADLCREALEIGRKTIGPNHPDYATRLNNLAGVLRSQGKYEEAAGLYREALEIGRKTIGSDHPNYAIHLNNLAGVLEDQGKYEEAAGLYREALEIDRKTIGSDHPDYAIHLNNLALVLKAQGKYEEAAGLLREALEIGRKTIGPDHPNYSTRLNNLAGVLEDQGKYEEAADLCREALEIDRKTIGPDHPEYAKHLNNLAWVLKDQGNYEEAAGLFREALEISRRWLGDEHPQTQTIQKNLALLQQEQP